MTDAVSEGFDHEATAGENETLCGQMKHKVSHDGGRNPALSRRRQSSTVEPRHCPLLEISVETPERSQVV